MKPDKTPHGKPRPLAYDGSSYRNQWKYLRRFVRFRIVSFGALVLSVFFFWKEFRNDEWGADFYIGCCFMGLVWLSWLLASIAKDDIHREQHDEIWKAIREKNND